MVLANLLDPPSKTTVVLIGPRGKTNDHYCFPVMSTLPELMWVLKFEVWFTAPTFFFAPLQSRALFYRMAFQRLSAWDIVCPVLYLCEKMLQARAIAFSFLNIDLRNE